MKRSRRATSKSSEKKIKTLALALLSLVMPAAAHSRSDDRLGLSGSVRAAEWERNKSMSSDRGFSVGSVWLQARPQEIAGLKPFFDARLQAQNLSRTGDSAADVREAFVETSLGSFDLKVGRQITVWGRADKANPTDVWSSRDYGLLMVDDEDQRLGAAAAQAVWNVGGFRLIGLWQPEWRSPQYPVSGLPAGITLQNGDPANPAGQFGLKLDRSGGDLDWSVSYSSAIDRTPDLRVLSSGTSGTSLQFAYNRIDVLGGDLAKNFGDFGFRGEGAYVRTGDASGTDPLVKNSFVYLVAGFDRSFWSDLNVNAQFLYRHAFDYRAAGEISDPSLQYLAKQAQIFSNQKDADYDAASLRADYKAFHETFDVEVALIGWFNNGLIRPKATYAFTDALKGSVGAELYRGNDDSFFGRLREASSVFSEVRYHF